MYNIKVQRLLRSLDKAYNGEVLPMKEWDTKRIPKTIKGILKKYGLAGDGDEVRAQHGIALDGPEPQRRSGRRASCQRRAGGHCNVCRPLGEIK